MHSRQHLTSVVVFRTLLSGCVAVRHHSLPDSPPPLAACNLLGHTTLFDMVIQDIIPHRTSWLQNPRMIPIGSTMLLTLLLAAAGSVNACMTEWTPPSHGRGPFKLDLDAGGSQATIDFSKLMNPLPWYDLSGFSSACIGRDGYMYLGPCVDSLPLAADLSQAEAVREANGIGFVAPLFASAPSSTAITWGIGADAESGWDALSVTWQNYHSAEGCSAKFQVVMTTDGNVAFHYSLGKNYPCFSTSVFVGVLGPHAYTSNALVTNSVVHGLTDLGTGDGFWPCLKPCNGYFAAESVGLVRCGNADAKLSMYHDKTPPASAYTNGHCATSVYQVFQTSQQPLPLWNNGQDYFILFELIDPLGQSFCATCLPNGESNPTAPPMGYRYCSNTLKRQ